MTIVVGLVHNGNIYMGCDSAGVGGLDLRTRKDSKIFINDEFIIGFTTSFRMGQLLQHSFVPPEIDSSYGNTLHRYMVNKFIPEVRKCLKDGGYNRRKDDEDIGGEFLVGVRGRLFHIHNDYQVGEIADEYDAVGCGENYALGSLYSDLHKNDPLRRIKEALKCAEYYSAGVRGPFNYLTL